MAKAVRFREITFKNPYKSILRSFQKDAEKLPEREAVFTWRRARSIMKKAPGRTGKRKRVNTAAGRFGRLRAYKDTPATRRSKRYGKYYWQKGLYSRPGHPPFYHGGKDDFNLRKIQFKNIGSGATIPHKTGNKKYAWRVGPMYRPTRKAIPVPALHEYGGRVKLNNFKDPRGRQLVDRGIPIRVAMRSSAIYPARPYMRPAAKEARTSSQRKSPHSLKKLTKLGGWKGKRTY